VNSLCGGCGGLYARTAGVIVVVTAAIAEFAEILYFVSLYPVLQ
jgi:hypothetical protein